MDENLKNEFLEIVDVVKKCPENLQSRAFEFLLSHLPQQTSGDRLAPSSAKPGGPNEPGSAASARTPAADSLAEKGKEGFVLPMRVKAFLKKYQIEPTCLERLFHCEGDEVVPIWSLETTQVAAAELELALFLALENAMSTGEFSFGIDALRKRCQEKRTYDRANFMAILKRKRNASFFPGIDSASPVSLSDEGMAELATVIKEKTKKDDK